MSKHPLYRSHNVFFRAPVFLLFLICTLLIFWSYVDTCFMFGVKLMEARIESRNYMPLLTEFLQSVPLFFGGDQDHLQPSHRASILFTLIVSACFFAFTATVFQVSSLFFTNISHRRGRWLTIGAISIYFLIVICAAPRIHRAGIENQSKELALSFSKIVGTVSNDWDNELIETEIGVFRHLKGFECMYIIPSSNDPQYPFKITHTKVLHRHQEGDGYSFYLELSPVPYDGHYFLMFSSNGARPQESVELYGVQCRLLDYSHVQGDWYLVIAKPGVN